MAECLWPRATLFKNGFGLPVQGRTTERSGAAGSTATVALPRIRKALMRSRRLGVNLAPARRRRQQHHLASCRASSACSRAFSRGEHWGPRVARSRETFDNRLVCRPLLSCPFKTTISLSCFLFRITASPWFVVCAIASSALRFFFCCLNQVPVSLAFRRTLQFFFSFLSCRRSFRVIF